LIKDIGTTSLTKTCFCTRGNTSHSKQSVGYGMWIRFGTNKFWQWFYMSKSKAILLQAWTGPEGSRRLRLPDFMTVGTWRW